MGVLVAAVAHQYPFRGRLMFYLMPVFVLAMAAGAEWVRHARLQAADAQTFPVRPMVTDPRPGCRPWIKPSPLDAPLGSIARPR